VHRKETQRVRKVGRVYPVSFVVSPIRDASGAVIGASTLTLDITERSPPTEAAQQGHQAAEVQTRSPTPTIASATVRRLAWLLRAWPRMSW
jgi:hypothetical protein